MKMWSKAFPLTDAVAAAAAVEATTASETRDVNNIAEGKYEY
jgi:hypothetical protein